MLAPLPSLSLAALEELYRGPAGSIPAGVHVGSFLGFLDTPGGRDPRYRAMSTVMFRWPRWGIDLERRLWWFVDRRFALGRFRLEPGPSRWRDGETIQLHYEPSRMPAAVKTKLYDEIKPLPDGRILGIGGIATPRDALDVFFFELRPAAVCERCQAEPTSAAAPPMHDSR